MTLVAEHIAGEFTCLWPDQSTETSSSRLDVPPSGRTLRSCGAGTTRTSGHSPTRNSTSCRSRSSRRAASWLATCVLHHMDHDFIDELALLPEAQGRGIGSSLVRDVMGAASARGVPVRLSVLVTNRHGVSTRVSGSALARSNTLA